MKETTYVYDGTEVRKTGRVAEKQTATHHSGPIKVHTLVEITPVGETDGWKKWVDPKHLYEVKV